MRNSGTLYKALDKEFQEFKNSKLDLKKLNTVIVLSAEEILIEGENKERILNGLKIFKKISLPKLFIFIGTKLHNKYLKEYLKEINFSQSLFLNNRTQASTRTQIRDLASFLKKNSELYPLVVSHSYHIPRIKRYCKKYNILKLVEFFGIGNIEKQKKESISEVEKIILYSKKNDLPGYLD